MLSSQQKSRLCRISSFLRKKTDIKKFNLDSFINSWPYKCNLPIRTTIVPDLLSVEDQMKRKDCGTTACVVGYFPLIFPKVFKYADYNKRDYVDYIDEKETKLAEEYNANLIDRITGKTRYGGLFRVTAGYVSCHFLQLGIKQWEYLFLGSNYPEVYNDTDEYSKITPTEVADRIDMFIKNERLVPSSH